MNRKTNTTLIGVVCIIMTVSSIAPASDWKCFRGPNGSGLSDEKNLPVSWSETENLKWKIPLSGYGSSFPIVAGERVFVTYYSGYGLDRNNPGDTKDLKRHLLCLDAGSGKVVWQRDVEAVLPEDPYRGYIREHGYASNTPVSDGQRVYVFFGKTGVLAYDMDGTQLWQVSVGTNSSNRRWGSAASPILYKNLVIINASEESRSLIALDKMTGKEVWKVESDKLELSYATPVIVSLDNGQQELVLSLPGEVWAFDPETGKTKWYAGTDLSGNISPSPMTANGIVYVFGGYPSTGGIAIRAGGKDDVTDSHVVWSTKDASYITTPVIFGEHLYWVSDKGYAYCMQADTAKVIFREKLDAGGGGNPFYASVVLADGNIYAVSRNSGTFLLAATPQFQQLAHNQLASDESDFNASPAISNGRIFLRSNKYLYCIENMSQEKPDS